MLSFLALNVVSQELIQRATKTMTYSFEDCSSLLIQGEKATIKITGKPQNTIELKIQLVAKHKKQTTALNDLKYIKFVSEKQGAQLNLKNYYESANAKIESNLSVMYELTVPNDIAIQLNNLYGAVNILNLSGKKTFDISFGRLEMQAIDGTTNLQLRYSNLTAQKMNGKLTGTLSKSDAAISNCAAEMDLNMKYGTLNASLTNDCENVRIAGTRTEIVLNTPAIDYNLDLKTMYSQVEVYDKVVTSTYKRVSKSTTKSIVVSTNYCPIKIKLK